MSSPTLPPAVNITPQNTTNITATDATKRPSSFRFRASPKCFICTKSVYGADPQVNINGNKIHKVHVSIVYIIHEFLSFLLSLF